MQHIPLSPRKREEARGHDRNTNYNIVGPIELVIVQSPTTRDHDAPNPQPKREERIPLQEELRGIVCVAGEEGGGK